MAKSRIFTTSCITDKGAKNNEDSSFLVALDDIFIAAVADGVGGLSKGEVASKYITKSIEKWCDDMEENMCSITFSDLEVELKTLAYRIHEELKAISEERKYTFGSTLTLAVIGKKKYRVIHVGDSRAYILNGKELKKITEDMTVSEYEKHTGEKISNIPESRKEHTLLECMGVGEINPKSYSGQLEDNYDFLICSDGFSNNLKEWYLKKELRKKQTIRTALENIIIKMRSLGETDNITAVAIRRRTVESEVAGD